MAFNVDNPQPGLYLDVSNEDYHAAPGISHSGLNLISISPASYMWAKNAPSNPAATGAFDVGTVIHAGILEPERTDLFEIGPTKGRDTIKFTEYCRENPDKIILTEKEYDMVRFAIDSVFAHPTAKKLIDAKGACESSIFWRDESRDILCKIRPDKDLTVSGQNILVDVKTTKSIADWRSNLRWKNPLFTLNYGCNAAFYLKGASEHYGQSYDEYVFLLVQTTLECGRYPVTVMSVTRQELEDNGFFYEIEANLDVYKKHLDSDRWDTVEEFPLFNDGVSISFENNGE